MSILWLVIFFFFYKCPSTPFTFPLFTTGQVNPKIVIIYDSMYQSTQLMAGAFADGAQTLGVEVRLVNAARRHITTIATEVLDAAAIVIGYD